MRKKKKFPTSCLSLFCLSYFCSFAFHFSAFHFFALPKKSQRPVAMELRQHVISGPDMLYELRINAVAWGCSVEDTHDFFCTFDSHLFDGFDAEECGVWGDEQSVGDPGLSVFPGFD
jgi:hypothetical protein